jgi:hypothetical protein
MNMSNYVRTVFAIVIGIFVTFSVISTLILIYQVVLGFREGSLSVHREGIITSAFLCGVGIAGVVLMSVIKRVTLPYK